MKINKNLLLINSMIATRSKYNKQRVGGGFIVMRISNWPNINSSDYICMDI